MLKSNFHYLRISSENPEPLLDPYYYLDPVILGNVEIKRVVDGIRNSIDDFCHTKDYENIDKLNTLLDLLSREGAQYTEFVAFFKVYNITLSVFGDIRNKAEQLKVLSFLIKEFCEKRHRIYKEVGYADTIIQALYDVGISRAMGGVGKEKIKHILREYNFEELQGEFCFINADTSKRIFRQTLSRKGIHWGAKLPDLLIITKGEFLIVEARHLKESGGEQLTRLEDLLNFLRVKAPIQSLYRIGFLDGVYANRWFAPVPPRIKRHEERSGELWQNLRQALKDYPQSYFVNTAGFKALIEDLKQI